MVVDLFLITTIGEQEAQTQALKSNHSYSVVCVSGRTGWMDGYRVQAREQLISGKLISLLARKPF